MTSGAHSSEYILVVEDDRDVRETLCEALILEGYSVVCVENGRAALGHLLANVPPCIILLDLMMPVMDGWTFRSEMLKFPALASVPVVVMTAASAARAAAAAAKAILYKPLDMGTVVGTVQEYCPHGAA